MSREQEFLNAAKTGDQETLLNILNDQSIKIDPDHADEEGDTALIDAAENGHIDIVRALLADQRVDPILANSRGITALLGAAWAGHTAIVNMLLADGRVDPDHADEEGDTALIDAAARGHSDIVRALLTDPRVDPNHSNPRGNTALIIAARNGHIDIVRALLADERVDPNHANERGNTALIWAAGMGQAAIINMLLADERIDPNHSNPRGNTALIIAARNGHSDIVCALIDDPRIDLSHADQVKKGMMTAAERENGEVLGLLLKSTGQRLSDDEIANLTGSDRGFYKRILTRLLWRTRFRGIVRLRIYFRRMRLRAAEAVYAPGGTGFDAAAERFSTAVASHQLSSTSTLTSTETNDITVGITQATDEPGEPVTKKQRT